MRRNKGITLIALVVTIIVLLILAAVSIATLTGENGILTQASRAKEKTEQAREKEQIELAYTAIKSKKMEIGDNTKISAKDLNDEFDNDGVEAQATDAEEGKIKVTFSKTGHEYIVDQEENIYGPSNVEDTKGPEVKIEVGKITAKSIEIKVKATDESGIGNYKYYLGGQLVEETNNDSYKYTELEEITNYNIEVKVTDKRGNVGETSTTAKTIYSLTTGKTLEKVSENIKMSDENENILTLPAGFKIAGDSATDVTGGVVIEDATYTNTKGSQFVWIPVGTIYTDKTKENAKTIKLNRYTFVENGSETPHNQDTIESYYQELKTTDKENATAKESVYNAFTEKQVNGKTKVEEAGGYYIGRYEARVECGTLDISELAGIDKNIAPNENWTGYTGGTLVEKPNAQVFNYITHNKAADLCRSMYTASTFESDLMNSYAWDTAIVFLQTFDDRTSEVKTKPYYSQQNSLNDELANQGTNKLTNTTKQDVICNIWDMASNCREWTTETSSYSIFPCAVSGGYYLDSTPYTSLRSCGNLTYASAYFSFRPLLIV